MTIIYRDKTTNHRILIPLNPALGDTYVTELVEVWNWPERDGVHMNARTNFMTSVQLERHYKKEEL